MAAQPNPTAEQPWHSKYPEPRLEPESIAREEVMQLLKSEGDSREKFVLVDLRRTDYEGGTITGAINLPAQSLHPTIPSLYNLFKAANVKKVIWFCGSSRGRGTRATAWFADYILEQNDSDMQSLVLTGGVKGWEAEKGEYVQYMQEYDATKWQ